MVVDTEDWAAGFAFSQRKTCIQSLSYLTMSPGILNLPFLRGISFWQNFQEDRITMPTLSIFLETYFCSYVNREKKRTVSIHSFQLSSLWLLALLNWCLWPGTLFTFHSTLSPRKAQPPSHYGVFQLSFVSQVPEHWEKIQLESRTPEIGYLFIFHES